MAEEKGVVNKNSEAVLQIKLQNGVVIESVLDTGFNGTLFLPRKFVEENAMRFLGLETVELVEKISTEIETALAEIIWLGEKISVHIFVSETDEALIGTDLLSDSLLEIDYKNLMVKITK